MASASIVHLRAGASITKARACGMQPTLQTMLPRLSIRVTKLTHAGCLA